MASEVDICNLALAHLGDVATVSSIDPPEGSAQATLCATFYPMTRDSLLEMHPWNFCTKRIALPLIGSSWPEWAYAYKEPSDALNLMAILDPKASDDYSQGFPMPYTQVGVVNTGQGLYTPQPFVHETQPDGSGIIYTNQENAVLRYTAKITDTSRFTPLFVEALSHFLASKLAGPILKGDIGAAESKRQYQMFIAIRGQAIVSDANQRKVNIKQSTPWMAAR
jgi:hypothetical protein